MERNFGVDLMRVLGLFMILTYHIHALGGILFSANNVFNVLVSLGGELGIVLFFVVSGFGVYNSIGRLNQRKELSWHNFMKKRCLRIIPGYYLAILIPFFITSSAIWFSKENIGTLFTHLLFIHNFFPSSHGAINGALWTMGVIWQFYLIAIPLYKTLEKSTAIYLLIFFISILCSPIAVFVTRQLECSEYFWIIAQQLPMVLNYFMLGMLVAKRISSKNNALKYNIFYVLRIAFIILIFLLYLFKIRFNANSFTLTFNGTIEALFFSGLLFNVSKIVWEKNFFFKVISFIAKYQYGIYLWHFITITNLLNNSPYIIELKAQPLILLAVLLFICLLVGIIFTELIDNYIKIYAHRASKPDC